MDGNSNCSNRPSQENHFESSRDYLVRASAAAQKGDSVLSIHLYLAAFEQSLQENLVPSDEVLNGMNQAWKLALSVKQHSLAEYIFEKLEPFWSAQEVSQRVNELQDLALDRLESFGFPRDTIEDITEMINQGLFELTPDVLCQFEEMSDDMPFMLAGLVNRSRSSSEPLLDSRDLDSPEETDNVESAPQFDVERESSSTLGAQAASPKAGTVDSDLPEAQEVHAKFLNRGEDPASTSVPSSPSDFDISELLEMGKAFLEQNSNGSTNRESNASVPQNISKALQHSKRDKSQRRGKSQVESAQFNYSTIVGFDNAIEKMGKLGIGRSRDPEFKAFVEMLNKRHGVLSMPPLGTVVFSSPAREDANYFMVATVGEMSIPTIRMRMDHNIAGQSVLCVMTSADSGIRLGGPNRIEIDAPTVVILEDLDTWELPWGDSLPSDYSDFALLQASRGAREAIALVQAALENPYVTVFVSAQDLEMISDIFGSIIASFHQIDVELPTEQERKSIWRAAQAEHPSMRGLDVADLVKYSVRMSRFEIFAVISEAIDAAYKRSLEKQCFCAVRTDDILMRLSNFQPLTSTEYQEIEKTIINNFHRSLRSIDNLLRDE